MPTRSLATDDAVAALTSAFGILALILNCMGIYAVVGHAVARRTQEIGIRLALGASVISASFSASIRSTSLFPWQQPFCFPP